MSILPEFGAEEAKDSGGSGDINLEWEPSADADMDRHDDAEGADISDNDLDDLDTDADNFELPDVDFDE